MPLPFLIVAGAAVLGASGHLKAREKNERAERISRKAKSIYDNAKSSLESAKNNTEESLLAFGYAKTNALEGSVKQFLQAFDRIRVSELSVEEEDLKFMIDEQGALELRKMSDIYSSTISSATVGVATGALIGLAASGSISIVTGGVSLAGICLATGDIIGAATVAGSSLSLGLSFTPLATIVAPVVLFTGISANANANENLEKAKTMLAQAESAVEEMKNSETMCNAIAKRSDMFRELLMELNKIFCNFAKEFDDMTEKKSKELNGRKIQQKDLNPEERKLTQVTLGLAGAVKAIIDVPLLKKEGGLSDKSQEVYDDAQVFYNENLERGVIKKPIKSGTTFCTGCGKKIVRNVKFCNYCGKKNTYMEV